MEVHYGTQTQTGGFSESNDFLQLTDRISAGLRSAIQLDATVDARVQDNLAPWVTPFLTNIEWVIGTPEGLDAAGNLFDDLTTVPGRTVIGTDVGASVFQGARNYLLDSFVSMEPAPVVVGDTDAPTIFGEDGQTVTIINNFEANVSYFERNATVEVADPGFNLDHFLGYKTRPPQGSQCGQDAPKRKGKACQAEEECGGYEDDDRDLETGCCVPKGFPRDRQVALADRFETKRFDVKKPLSLYNPADKNSEGIHDPETHLRSYRIKQSHTHPPQPKHVKHRLKVENQFGELFVTTITPRRLLVPTAKSLTGPVDAPDPEAHDLDHFKCYQVKITKDGPGFPKGLQAVAVDQFNQSKRYDIQKPKQLCVAANKNGEGLKNPDAGLMCYRIKPAKHEPKHVKLRGIHINNQLGPERFDTVKDDELCVPSEIKDLGIVTYQNGGPEEDDE